jgi:2-polyprenyl-3-methyl-5-hydroxy-6-metoxy-1,4-benzoquinol methylase
LVRTLGWFSASQFLDMDAGSNTASLDANHEKSYGEDYLAWKRWNKDSSIAQCPRRDALYFDAEMKRTRLNAIHNVLEIGFGNGSFLAYARGRGWQVTGTEANAALVSAATQAGYAALPAEGLPSLPDNSFDLIAAFDVFEHLPPEALFGLLAELRLKLRIGGVILARFPNGDSPMSLSSQNGDATHTQAISSVKLRYFAGVAKFDVVDLGPEAFPVRTGNAKKSLYRFCIKPIRAIVDGLIKLVYFPGSEVYFTSPNLVAVLRRPTE